MPRKRKSKLRPKLPSRVKKTRTKRGARGQGRHPELWGLGSIALGLFLGAVLYLGWNGGYVGAWLGEGLDRLLGDAKYVLPVALVVLGALVVTRSALVDVRPFRTGMAVLGCGLMITLGQDQGGYLGRLLGGAVGVALGATGSLLLGVLLMLVGSLLLSGASLGAILRRSGRIHHAARKARLAGGTRPSRDGAGGLRCATAAECHAHAAGRRGLGVPRRCRRASRRRTGAAPVRSRPSRRRLLEDRRPLRRGHIGAR